MRQSAFFTSLCHVATACAIPLASGLLGCSEADREVGDRFREHEPSTWTARSDCDDLLAARAPVSRAPRVGTWNIRYFPDSQEAAQSDEGAATDVPWLACAIATLDLDVLAIQEFKNTPEAVTKQQELIAGLNQHTSGDWQIQLAPCTPDDVQHPGFLYDASRVTGSQFREIPSLNPEPVCSNYVSPGFAGYFGIEGGPDFHFVSVHMAAGTNGGSVEDRGYSVSAMQAVVADAQLLVPDTDVIFAGDFNTSGCDECDPSLSSESEIRNVSDQLVQFAPPLSLLPATESCSREDGDNSRLLDHFAVAQSMQEVPAGSESHVSGFCEETSCSRLREWHEEARDRLSDHCPLTLDLAATDAD
jgi:endonuclease/exonuclease/phosphatase family metal-dependent hydrolase